MLSNRRQRTPSGTALTSLLVEVFFAAPAPGEALRKAQKGRRSHVGSVLETLDGGPRPVAEVARQLRLARQSVQRVADLLKQDGLVAYEANPRHRRAKLAALTPADARCSAGSGEPRASGRIVTARGREVQLDDLEQAAELLRRIRSTVAV